MPGLRSFDRVQEDDEEGADGSQEEGGDPPEEAAAAFALSQAGVDQGEGEPTDRVAGVVDCPRRNLHDRIHSATFRNAGGVDYYKARVELEG